LPAQTGIIVNGDDPLIAEATAGKYLDIRYFGIQDAEGASASPEHAGDVKACPRCGNPITYARVFLGHLGHYRCGSCGFARPDPSMSAREVRLRGLNGSTFTLQTSAGRAAISLPLPGLYNVYNALGAAAAAGWLGVPLEAIAGALRSASPAFGRMERFEIDRRSVHLALAKNPVGLNAVLRTAAFGGEQLHLLMMLNDNTADGHDVSWIWDADVELLHGRVASVVFGGVRAADMALRFKYAGIIGPFAKPAWEVVSDAETGLKRALALTPSGQALLVVPTYTALLDIRNTLTRLGYARPYWEE
jgi:UDP-N-acetylmuramyl tripeptide synthase